MIAYKCAKCGGELESLGDGRKAICPYCSSVMVLPTLDPEAFNRATELRQQLQFDQAEMAFERIVEDAPQDSESYWNLVLCRYGIEYVTDRDGITRVPTCHRMSYSSLLDDPDYQKALRYADGGSRSLYETEGAKIDRVLKRIAQISQSQPAYDIFISYKESDASGHPTEDSVIAQQIYDAIKEKHPNLNVFLSRVTLKSLAAGMEYEPVIFSALNTARLMIVVGTSRTNIESVWVRNEWSRFYHMMQKDQSKKMTVVFRNMNPNLDFPKELGGYAIQATEAEGFYLQDFLRGVDGLLGLKDQPKVVSASEVFSASDDLTVANLLRRAEQEGDNYKSARNYYLKAIDIKADCTEAWWRLLMLDTKDLQYMDDSTQYHLSQDAAKEWNMVQHYAGTALDQYTRQMQDYESRWTTAYYKRRTAELYSQMREATDDGRNFDQYSVYGPQGYGSKECLSHADAAQTAQIKAFLCTYEENHQRFQELQAWKRTRPVDQAKAELDYQQMEHDHTLHEDGIHHSLVAQNGFFVTDIVLAVLALVVAWFCSSLCPFGTDAFLKVKIHLAPLIVDAIVFFVGYKLIHYRGESESKLSKDAVDTDPTWAIGLAIVGYFAYQFQVYWNAKTYIPDLGWTCIFTGVIWVLLAVAIVGVIYLAFTAGAETAAVVAVICIVVGFVIYHFLAFDAISSDVLAIFLPAMNIELVVLAGIALVLSIVMYVRNSGALKSYDQSVLGSEQMTAQMEQYIADRINPVFEQYREYVSQKYLEDAQTEDEEG